MILKKIFFMISYSNLRKHEKFLKEKEFFDKSKWPQFDILFKDINKISKSINKNMVYSL